MNRRSWFLASLIGAAADFAVAFAQTLADWRLNPGDIFHDELGTHWTIVLETAVSWFVPVALVAFALSAAVLVWRSWR